MKNLIRLFYISRATRPFDKAGLTVILDKASENNTIHGITGVLCYHSGYFAQILEGDDLPVMETYRKIASDSRHSDIGLISIELAGSQIFEGWAMGGVQDGQSPEMNIDSILELRTSFPKQKNAATDLMQFWLKLLKSQSAPF